MPPLVLACPKCGARVNALHMTGNEYEIEHHTREPKHMSAYDESTDDNVTVMVERTCVASRAKVTVVHRYK